MRKLQKVTLQYHCTCSFVIFALNEINVHHISYFNAISIGNALR